VVVLAGLGAYLIASPGKHPGTAPSPSVSPSTPAQAAGSPSAAPVPSPTGSSSVDIYQWLPFTEQELAQAAAVTTRVVTDYNTFTYTETAAGYVAPMNGLITSQPSQTLKNGFVTLGVAQTRTSQKQVSSGTATISTQYAVTVSGQGSSWQVYDIEPASAGNN